MRFPGNKDCDPSKFTNGIHFIDETCQISCDPNAQRYNNNVNDKLVASEFNFI